MSRELVPRLLPVVGEDEVCRAGPQQNDRLSCHVTFLLPQQHPGPRWDKKLDRLRLESDSTGCQVISGKIPGLSCPSFFYDTDERLSLLAIKRAP